MNLRPLGYEHYDARLRHLGRSLPDAVTSGDERVHGSHVARLVFRVPPCSTVSRLQIGLQSRFLICGFPQVAVPVVLAVIGIRWRHQELPGETAKADHGM